MCQNDIINIDFKTYEIVCLNFPFYESNHYLLHYCRIHNSFYFTYTLNQSIFIKT